MSYLQNSELQLRHWGEGLGLGIGAGAAAIGAVQCREMQPCRLGVVQELQSNGRQHRAIGNAFC